MIFIRNKTLLFVSTHTLGPHDVVCLFSKARNDQEKLLNVQYHRRPENLGPLHRRWVCFRIGLLLSEWITPAGAQKKFCLTTSKHEVFGDSGRFYDPMTTESRRAQLTFTQVLPDLPLGQSRNICEFLKWMAFPPWRCLQWKLARLRRTFTVLFPGVLWGHTLIKIKICKTQKNLHLY